MRVFVLVLDDLLALLEQYLLNADPGSHIVEGYLLKYIRIANDGMFS